MTMKREILRKKNYHFKDRIRILRILLCTKKHSGFGETPIMTCEYHKKLKSMFGNRSVIITFKVIPQTSIVRLIQI